MGWKDAFDDAMKELTAIRQQLQRLDDPTVGLTALHGEVTQSRLKILEKIEGGVTGLREENREVRRRQDRMISDLNETRGELRELLDLIEVLRPLALAEKADDDAQMRPEEAAPPTERTSTTAPPTLTQRIRPSRPTPPPTPRGEPWRTPSASRSTTKSRTSL